MPTKTTQSQADTEGRGLPPAKGRHIRPPSDIEIRILSLVSEQFTIQVDQLARLLGCSESETLGNLQELRACACVDVGAFAVGEPPWVWLRPRGARLSGTGFAFARPPAVGQLRHRRAVNEVRVQLADRAPNGRWICERRVSRERSQGDLIPDAVFETNGERHALEVELSAKPRPRLRQIVAQHSRRYDAVVYFCGPLTKRLLVELEASAEFPKLVVRDSGPSRSASQRRREANEDRRRRTIAAMAAAVAERGYKDTVIRDVCSRAGVSQAWFHRVFTGKEDCFRAAHCGADPPAGRPDVTAAVRRLLDGSQRPPEVPFSSLHSGRNRWSREFVVDNQRGRILAAVTAVLFDSGYEGASVAKVCDRARLSRRTFYLMFKSLDDCILAASPAAGGTERARGAGKCEASERKPRARGSADSGTATRRGSSPSSSAVSDQPGRRPQRWTQPSISAPWQSLVLRLLLEQGATPLDQLDRFLAPIQGVPEHPVQALDEAGFIYRHSFLAGEPEWVWLKQSAVRLAPVGLKQYVPRLSGLARLRAINEIRLHVDSPQAELRWTGWRQLRRGHPSGWGCRRRIAIVEVGGERHAINLELSKRGREEISDLFDPTYDAVVCFCAQAARRRLESIKAELHLPKLIIRDLPGGDPRRCQFQPIA